MATSEKQIKANQRNAKLSTGAKSKEGKIKVSKNATKHGLLSKQLILDHENRAEFDHLLADLQHSLTPVGAYENILVEKMASVIWKQKRLICAETASIKLDSNIDDHQNKLRINSSLSEAHKYLYLSHTSISKEVSEYDHQLVNECQTILDEYDAIDDDADLTIDLIKKEAPTILKRLESEFQIESEDPDSEHKTMESYLESFGGLADWMGECYEFCYKRIKEQEKLMAVSLACDLVKMERSAPIQNELLLRYQCALDNELYKAGMELRKQQEFRNRNQFVMDI